MVVRPGPFFVFHIVNLEVDILGNPNVMSVEPFTLLVRR